MTKVSKHDRLWVNIKRTWRYIRPCGWNLVGYAIVSVVEGAVGIVAPILSAKVILDLTGNLMEQLIWSALAVFGLNMLLSVLTYFKNIMFTFFRGCIASVFQIFVRICKTFFSASQNFMRVALV